MRFWVNVNEPFEIKRDGATVVVDHQFMDTRRVIHLNETAPPPDTPRSSMGYSTGRFDGDALVIETTNFVAGALEPRYGVMHSADLKLTERLEVDGQTHELDDHVDDRRSRRVQRAAHAEGNLRAHGALARAVQLQARVSAVAARIQEET